MLTFDELRERLAAAPDAQWHPNTEPFFSSGDALGARRFGLRIAAADRAGLSVADHAADFGAPPPVRVDWRPKGVTPVKHQGNCGSCVAFATCAAMESAHRIATAETLDLSESHLFHCHGGDCEDGWEFIPALEAARVNGIGLEADFPYRDSPTPCVDIPVRLKLANWRRALSRRERQLALVHGPVIGGLQIFEDFAYYRDGVYRHVGGAYDANHAILVVGYDNDEEFWICKNSWGEAFGEGGYFRIGFGECELDDVNPFFAVDLATL